MARYYQRPENALKRAKEFIDVGKPTRALDALSEVIKNRRNRTNTSSERILEPIMFQYLELCVELKKPYVAKEGLYQYKSMVQMTNVASLETVVRRFLSLADGRTESARVKSHSSVLDVDDLDNIATPESILLSAVSGEDAQDRTDRAILTPWVKFLWESYRQSLDLLRTNSRVEKLYHDVAQQAFKFCLKYARKTEFRKLCDNLRQHLTLIIKQQTQPGGPSPQAINLSQPESLQMNLETRLQQLDTAIQMELWQEAYKAIEDIHGLMMMAQPRKMTKPQMMANYYQKLALVFSKAGNYLFHAAALLKLFLLSKELKKNMSKEEGQRMSSQVLVAVLSSPLPTAHPEFDRFIETEKDAMEKTQRLATLLGLKTPPTRASLTKDLVKYNVVASVPKEIQDLYNWLEIEFHPLQLCDRVQGCLNFIQTNDNMKHLNQYIKPLQELTLTRLIKQVGQVYQTIEFSRLLELAKFATPFQLERVIVSAARHIDMQVRVDHRLRCLHFGSDLSESQREDVSEGPTLQQMPSEQIRNQLMNMSAVLHKAIGMIQPPSLEEKRSHLKASIHAAYHQTKQRDHMRILERQKLIEDKKELLESLSIKKEEAERRQQEEVMRAHKEAEKKRLAKEAEEREARRREHERKQVSLQMAKKRIEDLPQTAIGQKIIRKYDVQTLLDWDMDDLMKKQVEELEKEKMELQARLKTRAKKFDHLERAKRLEEVTPLQEKYDEWKVTDRQLWDQHEKERITSLVEERNSALEHKQRLARMHEDKDEFIQIIKAERKKKFEEEMEAFDTMLNEEKKKRLEERKIQRKEERRQKWLKDKEEAERKKQEEQIRKEKEEKERLDKERQAKLDAQAEKQRQKELEVQKKLMEKEKSVERTKGEEEGRGRWQGNRESNWRRREEEKRSQWNAKNDEENDEADGRNAPSQSWRKDKGERDLDEGDGGKRDDGRRIDDRDDRDDFRRGDRDDFRRGDRDGFRRGGDRDDFRRGGDRDDFRRGGDRDDFRRGDRDDFRRGDRDDFRRGDRDDFRRGDRDDFRRGDRDDFRRGDRDDFRRGDRDDFRRGDRDDFRRGDRDDFRRGDRDDFRRRDDQRRDDFRRGDRDDFRRGDRDDFRRGDRDDFRRGDRDDFRRGDRDDFRRGGGDRDRDFGRDDRDRGGFSRGGDRDRDFRRDGDRDGGSWRRSDDRGPSPKDDRRRPPAPRDKEDDWRKV